jgi:single-stranded DNA-binding protein
MNGYHISTILGTIVADPTPIATVKGDKDLNGCDIRIAVNQSRLVDGKWVEHTCWLKLTAWFYLAKKLLDAKWCKKGFHCIFTCRNRERVYEGKNGPTKTMDYEVLDAQPVLVSSDYQGQAKARQQQHVETQRAPQGTPTYTSPHNTPIASPMADEDIPF